MTRVGAIIGSAAGGWLAIGLALFCAAPGFAQDIGPGVGPGTGSPSMGAQPAGSGAAAAPGAPVGSGHSLIDTLNRALDNALARRGAAGGVAAMPLVATPRGGGAASRGPVVVELFTSQGCSSCPPADEMFARFAQRPDVIALSLHVDYWDYLGWEDPFAQPAFTQRQKGYARAAGSRSIYTPQMMVEGRQSLVGADADTLDALVAAEQARPAPVMMAVSGSAGQYQIELSAEPPLGHGAIVQIVRYAPKARVEILRGENAGLVVDYANVVTAWHAVAEWDGRTATRLNAKIEGDDPAVVIVQMALPGKSSALPGPILAAARLNN